MMKLPLRTFTFSSISPSLLKGQILLAFLCLILTQQIGHTQCAKSLGNAQVLCYSPNGNGSTTVFLAEGNNIVQKILDKNGATLSSTAAGSLVQDSVLVKNNQIIKKLANGTIAYTKTIPPSVLSRAPSITAAVEMTDGTFILGGYQKFFDPVYPPNNKDSLVLVTTDASLNFQNALVHARSSGPYTPQLDSLVQLIPLPNNQFLVTYYWGFVGIINRASFNFSTFQKTGANLSVIKSSSYGYREQNQPIVTSVCGKNMILHGDISTYGQKSSFRGVGDALFSIDSMMPITSKTFGAGSVDYYGSYQTYSYFYRPLLRDTTFQLSVNAYGDPRISMNDFSKLEVKFYNNNNTPSHSKIIPFVAFDHVIRTGDTTCLVLLTENGQLKVFNPDCNNVQNLPDLTLANVNITTPSVQQGQILSWKVDIKNIGTAAATANFNVKAYISKDNVLSADDVQDGIIPTGNFAAGLVQTQVVGASTVVPTVPAGQYYLILKVDADGQITEGNESNNVLVSTSTFTVTAVQTGSYCTSKGVAPWELWTRNVTFNTINNTSEKFKDYATLGFSDYTNLSTTVNKGQSYPLSILPPTGWNGYFPNVFCRVWIDFNKNNAFEDNEKVLEQTNANAFTTNVLIPTTAATGSVRMRVSMKWGGYPTACETFDKGEVEDYTVNIAGGTTSNLPDLTVSFSSAYQCGGTHACTDGFSGINVRIKNQGTAAAVSTSLKFYQSVDETFDASDTPLLIGPKSNPNPQCGGLPYGTEILIPNLAAGASLDTFIYAGQPSNVYWIAKTDANNAVSESNENNNTFAQCYKPSLNSITTTIGQDTFRTNLATANQLQIAYLAAINPYCLSGANFISLTNTQLAYYLSTDTVLSANDIAVPFTLTSMLNFGIHQTDVTVPNTVASGVYYLIAKATVQDFCAGSPNTRATFRRVVVVNSSVTNTNDIALSITSTPSVFTKYTPLNFTISAKNTGSQAFTNVKIEFKFPTGTTNGGTATPSVGTWQEWCAGGTQCFTWTIPTLAANATATLNVPVYVLNPTSPMVATAKLLASTPVDNVVTNNTATISLNATPPPARSIQAQPTQLIPIVVDKIAPNPSDGEVVVELESLDEREVEFDFSDAFGKTVKIEVRKVEKGTNRVLFEVFELPQGIYFVSPSTNKGKNVPTKFIKL